MGGNIYPNLLCVMLCWMLLQQNVQPSHSLQTLVIINAFLLSQRIFPLCPVFTCLSFSTQGINTMKEVIFFSLKMLSNQLVSPNFWFLCWSFHQLTDSCCPLSESSLHPSYLTDACYIYQPASWKTQVYFWYFTNLPFFSFSSSFSSPSLVFPPLLRCCCRASLQPTWAKPPAF